MATSFMAIFEESEKTGEYVESVEIVTLEEEKGECKEPKVTISCDVHTISDEVDEALELGRAPR